MKNFNDCKEEIANKYGYSNWDALINSLRYGNIFSDTLINYENKAAFLFAEEVAKAQREACAENAKADLVKFPLLNGKRNVYYSVIDKDSILSTPLVTDKPG